MKLKLGIQRVGSIVFGRVLEQEEIGFRFLSPDNAATIDRIVSSACPDLDGQWLFVRGSSKDRDDDWFAYDFSDEPTAIQAVKDIEKLVKMVNSPTEAPDDCGLKIVQ